LATQATPEKVVELVGKRKGAASILVFAMLQELTSELQGEKGIPSRCLVHPEESGPPQRHP
jgi:hypothetical protein